MKGKKGTFFNQERRKISFWSGEEVRFSDPGKPVLKNIKRS
jgi:hypothetical protein